MLLPNIPGGGGGLAPMISIVIKPILFFFLNEYVPGGGGLNPGGGGMNCPGGGGKGGNPGLAIIWGGGGLKPGGPTMDC